MNTLRKDLKDLFMINPIMSIFLTAGIGLIFIYPVLQFINNLRFYAAIYAILPIAYAIYIISILACFANNYDWAIGIVLGIQALRNLINVIDYFRVGTMLYFLVYTAAAVLVFLAFAKSKGMDINFNRSAAGMNGMEDMNAVPQMSHCPSCGAPIEPGMKFCQTCGSPITNKVQVQQTYGSYSDMETTVGIDYGNGYANYNGIRSVEYSGNSGMVAQICSSLPALIFTIIFSASILTRLLANHSFVGIIGCIPTVILCVGCWLVYVGFSKGNVNTTGFSLISGCMIFEMVCSLIIPIILIIANIIIWIGMGSDAAVVCILSILAIAIYAGLYFFFWKGLRDTAVSARNIILGQSVPWKVSMYSIVIVCLGVVAKVITLFGVIAIRSSLEYYLQEFLSSSSLLGGGYGFDAYGGYGGFPMGDQIMRAIDSAFGSIFGGLGIMNLLVGIGVSVCAVIVLLQIRSKANQ